MTINERIKELRKDLKLNQLVFAEKLGMSQTAISWSEKSGNNIPDSTIKSICTIYNVNENWLRYGESPIYKEADTFDLNEFIKSKGASDLELDILKAYFELEPEIRHTVIEHFSSHLGRKDIEV